jgi:putative ABC transport system permease protein
MRLAEDLWANERPTAFPARVLWSLQLLIRALWAALGSHLDVHGAAGLFVPCQRARLALETHRTPEGRQRVATVQAVSDRERFSLAARMGAIVTDARQSLRTLRRTPAYTIAAVLVVTLGVGTSTAMFSVADAVLVKPLPFHDSDQLVRLVTDLPADPSGKRPATRLTGAISVANLLSLRAQTKTLSHVGVYVNAFKTLDQTERTTRLEGWSVEPVLFDMLGTQPLLGRLFSQTEGLAGADHVVLLSYGTWRDAFGSDRGMLGRSISLDGESYAVVGVMPPAFEFPFELATRQFWIPLALSTDRESLNVWLPMMARVATGVSMVAAAAETNAILMAAPPVGGRYSLLRARDELAEPITPALLVLMAAGLFVLVIACVNVANLCLVRTASRERELAIRVALGAGRGRLLGHLLTEGLVLALVGAVPGVGLALGGIGLLRPLATTLTRMDVGQYSTFPRLDEVAVNGSVLGFVLLVTVVTGVAFGLVPALRLSTLQVYQSLGRGAASATSSVGWGHGNLARRLLVIIQVGVAMVVLVSGGLLLKSFVTLANVPLGYDPSHVLTFEVATPAGHYRGDQIEGFAEDLIARVRQVPDVRSAAFAPQLPMVKLLRNSVDLRRTARSRPGDSPGQQDFRGVSDDYFQTMGIPVLAGRGFTADDRPGRPRAVVINRTLARQEFAGENPIGQPVYLYDQTDPWHIIGVVDDVRQVSLDLAPRPQVFVDSAQWPGGAPGLGHLQYYAVRTSGDPLSALPSIQAAVHQADPQAALYNMAPMEALVSNVVSRPRLYATVTSVMSVVAILVAAFGLYGTMAYLVVERTREIAIRVTLGARSAQVIGFVVSQGLAWTTIGVVLGITAASLVTRYLGSLLFAVAPLDTATYIGATVLFVIVAAVAAYIPARRAARLDPFSTLRAAE